MFIHCAAGVHRAPMMTLAVLCSIGLGARGSAQDLIEKERPVVDFADVYLRSVERFLDQQVRARVKPVALLPVRPIDVKYNILGKAINMVLVRYDGPFSVQGSTGEELSLIIRFPPSSFPASFLPGP